MDVKQRCFGCFEESTGAVCPHCGFVCAGVQQPPALPYGTILAGRYVTGKVLSMDGLSVTYLGYDLTLEMKTVVKEYLPADLAARSIDRYTMTVTAQDKQGFYEAGQERFMEEARLLAKLQSLNGTASIRNSFRENNTAYYVMDASDDICETKDSREHSGTPPFAPTQQAAPPSYAAAQANSYTPIGQAAEQNGLSGFPARRKADKKLLIGVGCGCAALLLAILLPLALKNGKKEANSGGNGGQSVSQPAAQLKPIESQAPLPGAVPANTPYFEDGQTFSHPGIGVTGEAPKDFAVTSSARGMYLERGNGTIIAIAFGYNGEYTAYSIEEYKAHLKENLQKDFANMGIDMAWDITGVEDVSLGGSPAYRVSTKIGDGQYICADAYVVSPKAGQGVYLVYVLQNLTVPDAAQHQQDNEKILQSLVVTDGKNCGLTLLESTTLPVKFAYDDAYCARVEQNPRKDGIAANIKLYPAGENGYPVLIENASGYADTAEEALDGLFGTWTERVQALQISETKTKNWGARTYYTRTYEYKEDGKQFVGMSAVTEMDGRLYSLDAFGTEENAQAAVEFLVDVMSTFAVQ